MATRVMVLGKHNSIPKKLVPIELLKVLNTSTGTFEPAKNTPGNFESITLIEKNSVRRDCDILWCSHGYENTGLLYLGNFNDGVVEII